MLPHTTTRHNSSTNLHTVGASFSRISLNEAINLRSNDGLPSRTKIVCTLGRNATKESIRELVRNGMNVARLNFSFEDHNFHRDMIAKVKSVVRETRTLCAIMVDTQGPVIRVGKVADDGINLRKGQFIDVCSDSSIIGTAEKFSVKFGQLINATRPEQHLRIAGGIHLKVVKKFEDFVRCKVVKSGVIYSGKRFYIRGSSLKNVPVVTQKDIQDIMFALSQGIEFLAVSHVKSPDDILSIRRIIQMQHKNVQIFAKIETQEALQCFGDILEAADGIIVSRGDLGMDIPIEQVTLVQKHITQFCNRVGKPVILSTQLLTSMVTNTQPTRAEATDIVNAVYDGSDCMLLGKETSMGQHPVLALQTLVDILQEAENSVDYRRTFATLQEKIVGEEEQLIAESIASSAVKTAFDVKAALVLVVSQCGRMARRIAKYRPHVPVLCLTSDEIAAKQCMVTRGVFPVLVGSMTGTDSLIGRTIRVAKKRKMCTIGDRIVIVVSAQSEHGYINSGNSQDVDHVLKVITIKY